MFKEHKKEDNLIKEKFILSKSNKKFGIYFLLVLAVVGCEKKWLYRDNRLLMGTVVETISTSPKAAGIVFAEFERIEKLLSKYDPESEISLLNSRKKLKPTREVYLLLKKAKEFCVLTRGAFDITVGPLMDIWGFTSRQFKVPDTKLIEETLRAVGCTKIILHDATGVVELAHPQTKIDLGALAKGYALDVAVQRLKEAGITDCLINAGGQVYAWGSNRGRGWMVALRCSSGKGVCNYLRLKDASLATSAIYEQYFRKDRKTYGHIIDPASGYPADSEIKAVSVIAKSALLADMLSTAVFVLGRKKAEVLSRSFPGVQLIIYEKNKPNPYYIKN